jgi:hypothetical protein
MAPSDTTPTVGPGPRTVQRLPAPDVATRARDAGITVRPGTDTNFSAHGGVVMYNPRVFAIYWGRDYGTPATGMNSTAQFFDSYFAAVVNSSYMDPLAQYNNVNRGTFLGSTWVDHDPGTPQTASRDDIKNYLTNWLDAGMSPVVPAQDEHDLLFVIFAPSEVTLKDNSHLQSDPPPNGFCGYHSHDFYHKSNIFGQSNLFWAIVTSTAGTDVVSHELVEAFTDRDQNGWHSSNAEIGDACSACGVGTLAFKGFVVASYWLVNANRCLQQEDLTPPPPPGNLSVRVAPPPVRKTRENYVFTVTNEADGTPVPHALITVTNGPRLMTTTETTGGNGQATFTGLALTDILVVGRRGEPPDTFPPGYFVQAGGFNSFGADFYPGLT